MLHKNHRLHFSIHKFLLLLLFLPPFTSVSATIDVEHYAAVSITEVNSPLDTSFIRVRIARMLNVPGLSPLEASMFRDYELYGTYYDPPNIGMDEFQLPLSDVTTALSKIF